MENAGALRGSAIAAVVGWFSGIWMTLLTRGADLQGTEMVEVKEKLLSIVHTQSGQLLGVMGLDTLFVTGYLAVFCGLFLCVPRGGRPIAALGLAFGIIAGVCDMIENVLYIVYGVTALHGGTVSIELPFQYYVSNLKWVAAFTSIGLTALVFPHRSRFEWLIVAILASFPLGGALTIARPELLPWRPLFFVVGMPLFTILFLRRARGLGPEGMPA